MSQEKEDQIAILIRKEVEKYYDSPFSNDEHFIKDIHILSDDLSAITLTLEKSLGIKLSKEEYSGISNVRNYAKTIALHVSGN